MVAINESNKQVIQEGDNEIANNNREAANDAVVDHPESLGNNAATAGARGLFGYSKLHAAASNGQAAVLKVLLTEDPNSSDINDKTVDGGSSFSSFSWS